MFGRKDDIRDRVDSMSSVERDEAIRRLERERNKLNDEIESILASYAKESGNHSLRPKRRRRRTSSENWDLDF